MHIGHYFSVIKPAVELDADVLIAQYHAPRSTSSETESMYNMLTRFGVNENYIHLQQDEFRPELYFELLSIARVGELERMTQFMSGDENDAHLLIYPVLMVHDVCGYDEVLVGEDQAQHLNYARDLIERYNKSFDGDFALPEARLIGGRVMSLTEPTKKMSKSEPEGCLFLSDSEEDIRRKIKAATMTFEGRDNLTDLFKKLGGEGEIPEMNSDFKPLVADLLVKVLAPGRRKTPYFSPMAGGMMGL
jgi:tryptophanyl-tRNA synthetase